MWRYDFYLINYHLQWPYNYQLSFAYQLQSQCLKDYYLTHSHSISVGVSTQMLLNSSYDEVVHWKPNLFLDPFGSAGTSFVIEVSRLFQSFTDSSSLECVSMKAIALIQILLLQKPSKISKTKDHISLLK